MKNDDKVSTFWNKAPDWSKSLFLVSSVIYGDSRKTFFFSDASRIQALSQVYKLNVSEDVQQSTLETLAEIKKERLLCIYFHKDKETLVKSVINKKPHQVARQKTLLASLSLIQKDTKQNDR